MEATIEKIVLKIGFRRLYNVFNFVRNIYMFIDAITEKYFGYSLVNGSKKEQERSKSNSATSGHLVKIWGRGSPRPASQVFLENFMLRHEAYIEGVS